MATDATSTATRRHPRDIGRRTFFQWLTVRPGRVAAAAWRHSVRRLLASHAEDGRRMGDAGAGRRISARRNADGHVRQSAAAAVGRHHGAHGRVCAITKARTTDAAGPVPGAGRQLRSPGLPGLVVSAVGPVHVPLPWRRLLRQRRAGLGSAAARTLPLRVASPRRAARGPGPALSRPCKTRLRRRRSGSSASDCLSD